VVLKKHNKENNYTQNRLRHKVSGNLRNVLIISPGVGEARPRRVRTPLTKHLSRAKVAIVATTLVMATPGGGDENKENIERD